MASPTPAQASTSTAPVDGAAIITRRLHLSGLAPSLPSASLLQRFTKSDGTLTASDMHRPTESNAVGVPPTHAWLTVTGQARELERAITALNGTTWKGAKVRVGTARHDGATGPKLLKRETEKEREKRELREAAKADKEKRRKKMKLSDKVDTPVGKEDVEQGEWGWYATPAGHLVRPLHMRPLHPLPRPTNPAPPMRAGSQGARTPPSRARRTTLDPKRYGAQHLEGEFLEASTRPDEEGREWLEYEEEEGEGMWKDKEGRVERVKKVEKKAPLWPAGLEPKEEAVAALPEAQAEEVVSSSEEDSNSDDDSIASSVSSGLFGASGANLDEPVSPLFPARTHKQRSISPLFDTPAAAPAAVVADIIPLPPAWNPEDDDAFSEGYAEDAVAAPFKGAELQTVDAAAEAKRARDILASLLGPLPEPGAAAEKSKGKKRKADAPPEEAPASAAPVEESEESSSESSESSEDEADEPESAPAPAPLQRNKRDALLQRAAIQTTAPKGGFAPVVRFDPGPAGVAEEDEADEEEQGEDVEMAAAEQAAEAHEGAVETQPTASGKAVQMQSLTEMFKPQEESAGFSLMANLEDLDLDLDFDLEPSEPMPTHAASQSFAEPTVEATSVPGQVPGFDPSQELPFFFPKVERTASGFALGTAPTSAEGTARDVRVRLMRAVQPFCRTETSEQINERWTARRGDLTQEWKRRHREALKKKKRGVTGSRRAGDMLPSR